MFSAETAPMLVTDRAADRLYNASRMFVSALKQQSALYDHAKYYRTFYNNLYLNSVARQHMGGIGQPMNHRYVASTFHVNKRRNLSGFESVKEKNPSARCNTLSLLNVIYNY